MDGMATVVVVGSPRNDGLIVSQDVIAHATALSSLTSRSIIQAISTTTKFTDGLHIVSTALDNW